MTENFGKAHFFYYICFTISNYICVLYNYEIGEKGELLTKLSASSRVAGKPNKFSSAVRSTFARSAAFSRVSVLNNSSGYSSVSALHLRRGEARCELHGKCDSAVSSEIARDTHTQNRRKNRLRAIIKISRSALKPRHSAKFVLAVIHLVTSTPTYIYLPIRTYPPTCWGGGGERHLRDDALHESVDRQRILMSRIPRGLARQIPRGFRRQIDRWMDGVDSRDSAPAKGRQLSRARARAGAKKKGDQVGQSADDSRLKNGEDEGPGQNTSTLDNEPHRIRVVSPTFGHVVAVRYRCHENWSRITVLPVSLHRRPPARALFK